MDRTAALLEAERRGILPPAKQAALAEARRRGLIGGAQSQPEQAAPAPEPGVIFDEKGDFLGPNAGVTRALGAFNQGMTFGLWEKVASAVKAVPALLDDRDFMAQVTANLEAERKAREAFQSRAPVTSAIAEGVGGVVPALATGGSAAVANTARTGGQVMREAARQGAAHSAAYGAGTTNLTDESGGKSTGDILEDVGTNAAVYGTIGGVVSPAIVKGGQLVGEAIDTIAPTIETMRRPTRAAGQEINRQLANSGTTARALLDEASGSVQRRTGTVVEPDLAGRALQVYDDAIARGARVNDARADAINLISQETGRTRSTAAQYWRDLQPNQERMRNSPLMLGDVTRRGPGVEDINASGTADMMEAIAHKPGTRGANVIRDAVSGHKLGQRERAQRIFQHAIGIDDLDGAIMQARQDLSDLTGVMYDNAFRAEQPFVDRLQGVVQRFQRIAGQRGGRPGEALQQAIETIRYNLGSDGKGGFMYSYPNSLRRFIDDRAAIRSMMDRLPPAEAMLVRPFYRAITNAVGRRNPQWLAANNAYGEGLAVTRNAVELGEQMFRSKGPGVREIGRALARMGPEQQHGVRLGYIRSVLERMDDMGDTHDMTKLFANDTQRRALRMLFGDDGANQLLRAFRDERITTQTYRSLQGSQTAQRQALQKRMEIDPDVAGAASALNPMNLLAMAGRKVGARVQDARDVRIAEILTTLESDPAAYRRALRMLEGAGTGSGPGHRGADFAERGYLGLQAASRPLISRTQED